MPRTVEEPPPSRPAYFWWLLANALALCFAIVSWFVCLTIFGNPEVPRNYQILGKLGRLPVLKKYPVTEVPNGNARSPKELYAWYLGLSKEKMGRMNALLMRNYLTNFDRPLLVTYIEGDYQIEAARKMTKQDFFDPGIAVRAQAMVKPDDFTKPMPYPVIIEYVIPTSHSGAVSYFKTGEVLSVKKSPNCAVVVHFDKITRDGEPALLLTVVPIAYAPFQFGNSEPFMIEPPTVLRPASGFPIFKAKDEKAVQTP